AVHKIKAESIVIQVEAKRLIQKIITEEERSARYARTSHAEVTWLFEIIFAPIPNMILYSDVAACYSLFKLIRDVKSEECRGLKIGQMAMYLDTEIICDINGYRDGYVS
ncbi:hypothetical protein Tco_0028137, partial [Tanacetum coccineum]